MRNPPKPDNHAAQRLFQRLDAASSTPAEVTDIHRMVANEVSRCNQKLQAIRGVTLGLDDVVADPVAESPALAEIPSEVTTSDDDMLNELASFVGVDLATAETAEDAEPSAPCLAVDENTLVQETVQEIAPAVLSSPHVEVEIDPALGFLSEIIQTIGGDLPPKK